MEPESRKEAYLANAAGQDVELPACPWDREEAYLADIGDRINDLDDEIEHMKQNPDVVDIVATYADLEAYDKTQLTDKDIIRVLEDETHDGKSTYYRYSVAIDDFVFVGEIPTGSGVTEIALTGTSGTLTATQIATVLDASKYVVFVNGGKVYTLSDKDSTLTYRTYINTDAATSSALEASAIYVQLDEGAVNYGTWSLEDITVGGTPSAIDLDELIDGTDDITVDLNDDNDTLLIGTHAKTVEITGVPATATQGTLTEEQLAALLESEKSVIKFNNEIYFLNDNGHEAGIRGYSHSGVENSKFMLKNITVTLSTGGWVLTTEEVGGGGIKTLTTADYNWPTTGTKTAIDGNRLAPGVYKTGESIKIAYGSVSNKQLSVNSNNFLIVGGPTSNYSNRSYLYSKAGYWYWLGRDDDVNNSNIMRSQDVVDNLLSTQSATPLSANQGKVLKGLIDALDVTFTGTNGTTAGAKGLVPAPATTDAGKFLKADGTWGEAGGGSGIYAMTMAYSDTNSRWEIENFDADALAEAIANYTPIMMAIKSYSDTHIRTNYLCFYAKNYTTSFALMGAQIRRNDSISASSDDMTPDRVYAYKWSINASTGAVSTNNTSIKIPSLKNDLMATSAGQALDATQGKVLNEHIGDLTTLTTTDKTSAVAAINELAGQLTGLETALNTINNGGQE